MPFDVNAQDDHHSCVRLLAYLGINARLNCASEKGSQARSPLLCVVFQTATTELLLDTATGMRACTYFLEDGPGGGTTRRVEAAAMGRHDALVVMEVRGAARVAKGT